MSNKNLFLLNYEEANMIRRTCKIDSQRRLFFPEWICERYAITEYQPLEITIEYGGICIKKFESSEDVLNKPYTGIVRKTTSKCRLSIPKEFCEVLGIDQDSLLIVDLKNNKIRLKKVK